jgi:hypothetical protein
MRHGLWVGLWVGGVACLGASPAEVPPEGAVLQSGPWKDFDLRPLGALCGVTREGALDCPSLQQAGVVLPEGDFQSVVLTGGSGMAGCALSTSGELACFDAAPGSRLVSEVPSGRYLALAGHSLVYSYACAIDEGGSVQCWGEGVDDPVPEGAWQAVLSSWDDIFCGLREDATLSCFAVNGIGVTEVTREVPDGSWDDVSVGGDYACATAGETLTCWGDVPDGALPDETLVQVGTGDANICGVLPAGGARCWGSGAWGQLDVPGGEFHKVLPAREQVCGLQGNGDIACWGLDPFEG